MARWLIAAVSLLALCACGEDEAPPPPWLGPIDFTPEPEPVQPVAAGDAVADDGKEEPGPSAEPGAGEDAVAVVDGVGDAPRPPSTDRPAGDRGAAADPAPAPPAAAGQAPCQDDAPADGQYSATVDWSNVQSTGGCFFFSGPGRLGRDDQLGTSASVRISGGRATVAFGGARFAGSAGERVSLRRVSDHDHGGGWRVTETIAGTWAAGTRRYEHTACTGGGERTIRARYSYQECDTANPSSCPGRCTIRADVTLRLR